MLKLNNFGCGKMNLNSKSLSGLIVQNDFYCLANNKSVHHEYRKVMNRITPLLDYQKNTEYLNFFLLIESFQDSNSFAIAIELLKFDYKPNYQNSDVIYEKVNHYVLWHLLMPHIYSLDGELLGQNGKKYNEVINNFHYFMTTKEFYNYFKNLWTEGKIELKSTFNKKAENKS